MTSLAFVAYNAARTHQQTLPGKQRKKKKRKEILLPLNVSSEQFCFSGRCQRSVHTGAGILCRCVCRLSSVPPDETGLVGGGAAPVPGDTTLSLFFSFACMSVLSLGFRPGVRSVHQTRAVRRQRSRLVSKVLTDMFLGWSPVKFFINQLSDQVGRLP